MIKRKKIDMASQIEVQMKQKDKEIEKKKKKEKDKERTENVLLAQKAKMTNDIKGIIKLNTQLKSQINYGSKLSANNHSASKDYQHIVGIKKQKKSKLLSQSISLIPATAATAATAVRSLNPILLLPSLNVIKGSKEINNVPKNSKFIKEIITNNLKRQEKDREDQEDQEQNQKKQNKVKEQSGQGEREKGGEDTVAKEGEKKKKGEKREGEDKERSFIAFRGTTAVSVSTTKSGNFTKVNLKDIAAEISNKIVAKIKADKCNETQSNHPEKNTLFTKQILQDIVECKNSVLPTYHTEVSGSDEKNHNEYVAHPTVSKTISSELTEPSQSAPFAFHNVIQDYNLYPRVQFHNSLDIGSGQNIHQGFGLAGARSVGPYHDPRVIDIHSLSDADISYGKYIIKVGELPPTSCPNSHSTTNPIFSPVPVPVPVSIPALASNHASDKKQNLKLFVNTNDEVNNNKKQRINENKINIFSKEGKEEETIQKKEIKEMKEMKETSTFTPVCLPLMACPTKPIHRLLKKFTFSKEDIERSNKMPIIHVLDMWTPHLYYEKENRVINRAALHEKLEKIKKAEKLMLTSKKTKMAIFVASGITFLCAAFMILKRLEGDSPKDSN